MMAVINSFLLVSVAALLPAVLANNSFSFFDALSSATAQYNKDSLEGNAFKALGEHPLEGEDLAFSVDGLSSVYKLSFTLGETVCSHSEDYQEKQCTFKENGKVKRCTATVSVLSEHPSQAASVEVNCEEVRSRGKRSKGSKGSGRGGRGSRGGKGGRGKGSGRVGSGSSVASRGHGSNTRTA